MDSAWRIRKMRKLLTTLTALTLIGGVLLSAPARTLAAGGSAVYWISTASVGAGTSCASPTHEYDAANADKRFNDRNLFRTRSPGKRLSFFGKETAAASSECDRNKLAVPTASKQS